VTLVTTAVQVVPT